MARGPRPKSKEVVAPALTGAKGYVPPPPSVLSPHAAAKWVELVPQIAGVVQLRDVDADALMQYCEAAALRAKALTELHEPGTRLVVANPNGAMFPNPLLKIIKEADSLMNRLATRFGLDPGSRGRLKLDAPKTTGGALADFLSRGKNRPVPALAK